MDEHALADRFAFTHWPRRVGDHDIADELAGKNVALNIGGSVYNPSNPMGKLLFNVVAMITEFEADLIKMRTREGMAIAKAKGKLLGKQSKLSKVQGARLVAEYQRHRFTTAVLAQRFGVGRATLYRAIQRAGETTGAPAR